MALYKTLTDKGPTAAFVLGILGVAAVVGSLMSNSAALSVADAAKQSTTIAESGALDIALNVTLLFFAICVIGIVLFGIIQIISNPKQSMKGLIGFAVLAIIFFAAYSMAGEDNSASMARLMEKFQVTGGQSKIISGAMVTTAILAAIAVASFVIFEIINFFK